MRAWGKEGWGKGKGKGEARGAATPPARQPHDVRAFAHIVPPFSSLSPSSHPSLSLSPSCSLPGDHPIPPGYVSAQARACMQTVISTCHMGDDLDMDHCPDESHLSGNARQRGSQMGPQ